MNTNTIATWHRRLSWLTPQLAVSGDLPWDRADAEAKLDEWREAGITHILDLRGECNDKDFVHDQAPELGYTWIGTHDNGGEQEIWWFDEGIRVATEVLADPQARLLVHCHMGINRAPSMAFAILLSRGSDLTEALDRIRSARPIAAIAYAEDAIEYVVAANGMNAIARSHQVDDLARWRRANPIDTPHIIATIRQAS